MLLPNREGNALVITLLITLALSGLVFGALMSTQTETRLTSNHSMDQKAFYLAERGVEESIAYLSQLGEPLTGSGPEGENPIELFDAKTTGEGSFEAWADPLNTNAGKTSRFMMVTVRATLAGTALSKSVRIKLGQENFSRYAYFTNHETTATGGPIWFATEDEFFGPVHSNDQFHIMGDPIFHEEVITGAAAHDLSADSVPVYGKGVTFNGAIIPMPTDANLLKDKSKEADGIFFAGGVVQIVMFVNGLGEGKLNMKKGGGPWNEYDVPANGVLYVNGDIELSGTLKGQLTIASAGSIEIVDNVLYDTDPRVDGTSTDILGLFAEENIMMDGDPGCLNNDIADETVMGSILTLDTSFYVENYNSGTPRGALVLYGGLIQERRGPVSKFSGDQVISGYSKDYTYDPRLRDNPPPAFPTTGVVRKMGWEELDPSEDITINAW